ncbi:uncharacterized protein SCHCODRAFT_01307583 [Schizophyllum commune H4-8]|uniref:uncharacterized protein n=1 Tax=Schizophyllum commune (strain H4-8 / FGSC 9210) TaxID=578458 RepID=UPI0021602DF3|nr:uncharacterized protein SCHCODRAFT_01307583 [Schizophyllum commune H4-8]KAI5891151.1 hypothetical protein SCHCODRAFT_01307583 [Schizophyllum commune H4-8]
MITSLAVSRDASEGRDHEYRRLSPPAVGSCRLPLRGLLGSHHLQHTEAPKSRTPAALALPRRSPSTTAPSRALPPPPRGARKAVVARCRERCAGDYARKGRLYTPRARQPPSAALRSPPGS